MHALVILQLLSDHLQELLPRLFLSQVFLGHLVHLVVNVCEGRALLEVGHVDLLGLLEFPDLFSFGVFVLVEPPREKPGPLADTTRLLTGKVIHIRGRPLILQ